MTIENGGEIDIGDGNCLVTARGTKDGLIIRMDGRADLGALQRALESFLNNRHSFLQGNEVFLEWVGAKPSPESRDRIANLFKLHGVKVFSSRGAVDRDNEQRCGDELFAYDEKLEGMVALGGGRRGEWGGKPSDSAADEGSGKSLFDGVRSLGLGRGAFCFGENIESVSEDVLAPQRSGDEGVLSNSRSSKARAGSGSATVSSMARFSQIVSEADFDVGSGGEVGGGEKLGPEGLGMARQSIGSRDQRFFGTEEDDFDFSDNSACQDDSGRWSTKGGSLKSKALASLGRVNSGVDRCGPLRRDGGSSVGSESQVKGEFASKSMSSSEGFLGADLRSSYGMEGSSWDDADARTVRGTIRSGQRIETEHSLVILGDVNSGGEIVAGGDIIVLGTLRGVAHAGAFEESGGGRVIIASDLQPTQLRIGNVITRGGADSSQGAAMSCTGVRASLGFGGSKGGGAVVKAQHGVKPQAGLIGSTSMEVAWVEGSTIVVEPYQSRGMVPSRRGVR